MSVLSSSDVFTPQDFLQSTENLNQHNLSFSSGRIRPVTGSLAVFIPYIIPCTLHCVFIAYIKRRVVKEFSLVHWTGNNKPLADAPSLF